MGRDGRRIAVLGLIALLAATMGGSAGARTHATTTLTVGTTLSLTGDGSVFGPVFQKSGEFAVDLANKALAKDGISDFTVKITFPPMLKNSKTGKLEFVKEINYRFEDEGEKRTIKDFENTFFTANFAALYDKVDAETVRPGSREWERWRLHNAANLYHLQRKRGIGCF